MIYKNHPSKRKNINLVIGLGKSGFWAAKYLRSIDKRVIVWESKDGIEFLERKTALEELNIIAVSYTHLRAHETSEYLVCRLLL